MMGMIIYTSLTIVAAHLVLGLILWFRVRKLYSHPGHFGFPILGNLYYFYKTLFIVTIDGMDKYIIEMAEKYGKDGFCMHWLHGCRVLVTVTNPQVVKELAFHTNLSGKPEFIYGGVRAYLDGPFSNCLSDDLWKVKRKEYNIFLKKSQVENNYYNTFIKCSNKLVELMSASPSAVDAHHKTTVISQDVASETLFGVETSLAHHPGVIRIMSIVSDLASVIIGNPKLAKWIIPLIRPLDTLYFGKLAELRKMFIDLASEKNQSPLEEKTLSMQIISRVTKFTERKEIHINAVQELLLTASHTVTVVLSNSIIFLAVLPDIQEKAWQEQFEIFGNDDREPTMDDLGQMHFLDRYIKEALRFSGPTFIGKFASEDIKINGVTIPKGACVGFLLRYMRMDSKLWENPDSFDPDRFLDENELLKYMYSPFGIGIRNCPGTYFAIVMMKITLSKLLRKLKLRPADDKMRFQDIQFKYSIMTEVANPPMLRVEERT